MSDLEQFQRMAAIFEAARSLHGDERASFLQTHCKGETELITRVLRLLRHHESTQGLLEAPITPPADLLIEKTHAPATVPSAIGAYRVIRLIGSGGMGAVYLAEQPNPRRMVALKVIRPGAVSADTLRRLGSEAALLGKLRHPGIAQIYESGTYHDGVGDRPYFAMEYVDGQALPDYVRARHLDTSARLELVAQLCDTVQHAHQRGVIHRDLKPANILVDASGQPKVLDFGVARSIEPDPQSLATRPGALLGTVGYMSPEQIEAGADAVDTRTDIHSLGVILYELMTGRLPYELSDTTLIGALNRIREADPTPLGRVAPSLRGDLETICAKALEKDKSRRYSSASDLGNDIRRFLRNEPISARPATTLYQLRKLAQRNKPFVVAASVVLVALVGTLIATTVAMYEISRERDEAIAAKKDAAGATGFLNEMLTTLDPRQREEPDVSLTDFLDDVAERLDAGQLADQPRVEAAVRRTIGEAYRELGGLDSARAHLDRSLALYEADGIGTPAQRATVLSGLGALWLRNGDLERAEQTLRASIEIFESIEDEEPIGLAVALHTLATIRLDQRRVEQAEALLRRAIELHSRDGKRHRELLARALISLAGAFRLSGRMDEARAKYQEALAIQRTLRREPGLDVAKTLSNLGVLYMYDETPDAAQPLLEEAFSIRTKFLPKGHPDLAHTVNSLGGLHSMRQEWSKAEEMYREAIRIRIAAVGENHYSLATPYVNLGVAQREQGRFAEAVESLERAIAIRRSTFGEQHVQVALPLYHLGLAFMELGDIERALEASEESLSIFVREKGADSTPAAIASTVVGHALAAAGRFEEAEPVLLRADQLLSNLGDAPATTQRALKRNRAWIADFYNAWDEAEPGRGYNRRAQEWEPGAAP